MENSKPSHRAARTWEKIIVESDPRMTEAIAAFLADLSGSGVEISTGEDTNEVKEGTPVSERIIAYVLLDSPEIDPDKSPKAQDDVREFLDRLAPLFPDCPPPELWTEIQEEEDWSGKWKSFFSTFRITPTLTIRPTWEKDVQTDTNDTHVIEMDPGLAFGTGHHASTRLALLLLEGLFQKSGRPFRNILDVGTGSGILAMGCGLFGGENILAIDNDPDAVVAAAENVERNGLAARITVSGRDVTTLQPGYELIVANITHDTLSDLATTLTNLLLPEGYLVLSGILKDGQDDSIRKIYTGLGLDFIKSITEDEWAALQFQKV